MNNNILATVLMPVYNAEKYLKESINSILNQTYTNFKFLIINDGSTDKSKEIILSYKDKRIIYLENEKNSGIIFTLNKGIDYIDTKYIIRMDADDISVPERFVKQIKFMEENPEIGVSGGQMQLFGHDNSIWEVPLSDDKIKTQLIFSSGLAHPTVIIRTEILKKHKIYYPYDFPHMEDYAMWYKMSKFTKFKNLNKILLNYRYENQNITVINKNTNRERKRKIYSFILDDIKMDYNKEDLELHIGFDKEFLPNKKNIKNYVRWFDKLINHNLKTGIYSDKYLNKIINNKRQKLFYICLENNLSSLIAYIFINKGLNFKKIIYTLKYYTNKIVK